MITPNLQMGIFHALLAGTLWGIGPLLLKRGMVLSNVSTATLVEQHVSVIFLVILGAIQGELRLEISAKAFWAFAAAGMVGASFGKVFYYKGIDKVGASKATSVKNSSPILTVILAALFLGEQITSPIAVGVLLIVIGVLVLTQMETKRKEGPDRIFYFLYPLIAALCFGVNPIFKKIGVDAASLPILGALITQTGALIVILIVGPLLNIRLKWERVPTTSLVYFVLSGVTEALGSLFTFYALGYAPTVLVSPLWRISPLVTFVLVRFTLKGIEVVTMRDGLAAAFIVVGIFVMSRG